MSGEEGSKGESPFFGFVDTNKKELSEGYFHCPLKDVVSNKQGAPQLIVALSDRFFSPSDVTGDPDSEEDQNDAATAEIPLQVTTPVKPTTTNEQKHRFLVHFVKSRATQEAATDPLSPATEILAILKAFYSTTLVPTLKEDMYYGDSDGLYGVETILEQSFSSKHIWHVILTGELKDKKSAITTSIPIGAVSFYSHLEKASLLTLVFCAMSSGKYTKGFGKKGDSLPWRRRGIFKFLFQISKHFARSLEQVSGVLYTQVCLTARYQSLPVFEHLMFLPNAICFKDRYSRQVNKLCGVIGGERHASYTPFVAEGCVYCQFEESINGAVTKDLHPFIESEVTGEKEGSAPSVQDKADASNWICAFCAKAFAHTTQTIVQNAGEWKVLTSFAKVNGIDVSTVAVCTDCKALFTLSGTECSLFSYKCTGLCCFTADLMIHNGQRCNTCTKPCHLGCSVVESDAGSTFSLLGKPTALTCMSCSLVSNHGNTYGENEWGSMQEVDFSPIILETPFPITLERLKMFLFMGFDRQNDILSKDLAQIFGSKSHMLQGRRMEENVLKNVWCPVTGWKPDGALSVLSFCNLACGSCEGNELEQWKALQFVPESLSFFRFGSKLRIADLEKLQKRELPPLPLNFVDLFISVLSFGSVGYTIVPEELMPIRNHVITSYPLLFTRLLMKSVSLLGRPAIARFVEIYLQHQNDTPFHLLKEGGPKVLLFPFQGLHSNDMFLAVVLLHNITEDVTVNAFSEFRLISYGSELVALNAQLSYILVICDFIDMAIGHVYDASTRSVGRKLHMKDSYFSDLALLQQKLSAIVPRQYTNPAIGRGRQSSYLLDDILYFYRYEADLSPATVDDLICSWSDHADPLVDSLIPAFHVSLKALYGSYLESLLPDVNNGLEEIVRWVTSWKRLLTDELRKFFDRLLYTDIGKKIIIFLYKNNNISCGGSNLFFEFFRLITSICLIQKKRTIFNKEHYANYVIDTGSQFKCKTCWMLQLGDYTIGREIHLPFLHAVENWKEFLMLDADKFHNFMEDVWGGDDANIPVDIGDATYPSLTHYLVTAHNQHYTQSFDNTGALISSMCYWEIGDVETLVSLLVHHFHPSDKYVVCTSDARLRYYLDQKQIFKLPAGISKIICTAHKEQLNHFVVFYFDIPSKQVFLFDGTDGGVTKDGTGGSTLGSWKNYCLNLMETLSLIKLAKGGHKNELKSMLLCKRDVQVIRPLQEECKDSNIWFLIPAYLAPDGVLPDVCPQFDGYSCGPIAVTHIYRLLGGEIGEIEEIYKSKNAHVLLEKVEWENYLKAWLSSCYSTVGLNPLHRAAIADAIVAEDNVPADDGVVLTYVVPVEEIDADLIYFDDAPSVEDNNRTNKPPGNPTGNERDEFTVDNVDEGTFNPSHGLGRSQGAPNLDYSSAEDIEIDDSSNARIKSARNALLASTPATAKFMDLRTALHVQMKRGLLQRLWHHVPRVDFVVNVDRDDKNPDLKFFGLPPWIQAEFVGETFPYISRARQHIDKKFYKVCCPTGFRSEVKWNITKDFATFLFKDQFLQLMLGKHKQWFTVLFDDYNMENAEQLEKYILLEEKMSIKEVGLLHPFAIQMFYSGPLSNISGVMHVPLFHEDFMRQQILQTYNAYQNRNMLLEDTVVKFICFAAPFWFVSAKQGNQEVERRVSKHWVQSNVSILLMQKAIGDPYHKKKIEASSEEENYTYMQLGPTVLLEEAEGYITDELLQISHILFKPHSKYFQTLFNTQFDMSDGHHHRFKKGWYAGITEGDPTHYDLLEYQWVVDNVGNDFANVLTTQNWSNKWIQLPAGSSKDAKQGRRKQTRRGIGNDLNVDDVNDTHSIELNQLIAKWIVQRPRLEDSEIQWSKWPKVQYQQKFGDHFCIFYSLASAVHFMASELNIPALFDVAQSIRNCAPSVVASFWTTHQRANCLINILNGKTTKTKISNSVATFDPELTKGIGFFNEKNVFDPLSMKTHLLPTLAICKSIDGSVEHAVTFFGNWIFDSNEEVAFPISRQALNRCVPYGFERVTLAWRFFKRFVEQQKKAKRTGTADEDAEDEEKRQKKKRKISDRT